MNGLSFSVIIARMSHIFSYTSHVYSTYNVQRYHCAPIQNIRLPYPKVTQRCCPTLHAILYKYFGEKTVQMKRCVLKAVQASITASTLLDANIVNNDRCCSKRWRSPSRTRFIDSRSMVAEVHHKGPAQLPTNVRSPTAPTLYPPTPL